MAAIPVQKPRTPPIESVAEHFRRLEAQRHADTLVLSSPSNTTVYQQLGLSILCC